MRVRLVKFPGLSRSVRPPVDNGVAHSCPSTCWWPHAMFVVVVALSRPDHALSVAQWEELRHSKRLHCIYLAPRENLHVPVVELFEEIERQHRGPRLLRNYLLFLRGEASRKVNALLISNFFHDQALFTQQRRHVPLLVERLASNLCANSCSQPFEGQRPGSGKCQEATSAVPREGPNSTSATVQLQCDRRSGPNAALTRFLCGT